MINYILFDMDNCLYPASSGLCTEMNIQINHFVADFLSIPTREAGIQRKAHILKYGTTLNWLKSCHGFTEDEEYNNRIHPSDVGKFLTKSKELKDMLESLPYPASILTNAPAEHAGRVLEYLEITEYFHTIMDLSFSDGKGKPHRETFSKALENCGSTAKNTLFIDDVPGYLIPFSDMGGQILLVDEDNCHSEKGIPSVRSILELSEYLEIKGDL